MRRLVSWWPFLVAGVSATVYMLAALSASGEFGFPLDDAWIHQVYARNLGTRGELAFFPGHLSAGSTSPLWTICLSLGYLLQIDYRAWTLLLAGGLYAGTAVLAGRLGARLGAALGVRVSALVISLLVLLEWHMAWAAASGMEVPLFAFLSLAALWLAIEHKHFLSTGVALGLLAVTRPEGLVLGGILGFWTLLEGFENPFSSARGSGSEGRLVLRRSQGLYPAVVLVLGASLSILPYLAFNLAASGTVWPNTFYAKTQEYLVLTAEPYAARWGIVALQPIIGGQWVLLPGLVWCLWRAARVRAWIWWVAPAWVLALISLYAWRLPVSYQHGRYLMPIIPFLLIYGWAGMRALASGLPRVLRLSWAWAAAALTLVFWFVGAGQFATDVAIINCEMVQTARWTAANLPPSALVAAHDIGAQGYFSPNPILDLAGLVSPEVIPFIRDEARLTEWIHLRGAMFLVFFPSWYPTLGQSSNLKQVYSPECRLTREAGGESLVIYRVGSGE